MSDVQSPDDLCRRKALKMLVGPVAAAELPAPAPRFFRPEQIRTLEAVCETILSADDHSPGAKAARVWEYVDDLVADSSPASQGLWNGRAGGYRPERGAVLRKEARGLRSGTADCATRKAELERE